MRALQIAVPPEELDAVREVLDDLSVPFTVAAPADDEFVSKVHGMEVAEAEEEDRSPKECHRCGELSPHHREACMKCGLPFDPLAAYDAGTKASKQANLDEFQSMVQAEVAKILGDMNVDPPVSDTEDGSDTRDASA